MLDRTGIQPSIEEEERFKSTYLDIDDIEIVEKYFAPQPQEHSVHWGRKIVLTLAQSQNPHETPPH